MKKLIAIILMTFFVFVACSSDLKKARKLESDGDWANAQDLLVKAVSADPKNAKLRKELGYVYEKQKYYELAEKEYTEALKLDPSFVDAHFNRGSALYHLRRYPEAIQEFELVLKMDPNNAKAMNNLALALQLSQNDQQRALSLYQQAIKIDPNNATYHENLGILYKAMGQDDKYAEEMKKSQALKARQP